VRAHVDAKPGKSADKRWDWVRRGAPLILEIGPRDAANAQVSFMRRDVLRDGDKLKSHALARDAFVAEAPALLQAIQDALFAEAKTRLDANIRADIKTYDELAAYYGADEDAGGFKGWVRAPWSRPSGAALDAVVEKLKALKLTIRNAPMDQPSAFGPCLFTGAPGVEEILIARAY
jgi:prolyl-tRNA synthetase